MLVSILSFLPFLTLLSFTAASHPLNYTLEPQARTFPLVDKHNWLKQKCSLVSGIWRDKHFDFGCLCEADIEDFTRNNHLHYDLKDLLHRTIHDSGDSWPYPANAQPLCRSNGDYHCGSLPKNPDGTCGKTTCPHDLLSTNGGCCPRGQVYQNGKCCGKVGCSRSGGQCTPELTCQTYESNGVCCPKGTSNWVGQKSICCPKGQIEQNGKCACPAGTIAKGSGSSIRCENQCSVLGQAFDSKTSKCACPSGQSVVDYGKFKKCTDLCKPTQKFNPSTGKCDSICDESAGYIFKTGWKGTGLCCRQGQTACNTVCCPSGKEEVGSTGKCCIKGSTVEHGQCVSPTAGPKRRDVSRGVAINLNPSQPRLFGLAGNKNGELCPRGLAACPIEGMDQGSYECIDPLADLQSCGGCASMGTGVDCTLMEGARWMGCNVGKCEVYSCKSGYVRSKDGSKCVTR